ncbi:MAG: hypothetical protein JNN07_10405 [Verrucomicrobiales bacterium]|nr:hypothetical protein [Verrucomicrobiales bacterium]
MRTKIPIRSLTAGLALTASLLLALPSQGQSGAGNSLVFDAPASQMILKPATLSAPWTAELWVKRQDSSGPSAPLFIDSTSALKLEQFGTDRLVGLTKFGVDDYAFDYQAPVNQWVHLAFVGSPTSTRLLVNGALKGTLPVGIQLPLEFFGYSSRFPTDRLRGEVDEMRLWRVERTEDQIKANLFHPLTGTEESLVGYWRYDDESNSSTANLANDPMLGSAATLHDTSRAVSDVPFDAAPPNSSPLRIVHLENLATGKVRLMVQDTSGTNVDYDIQSATSLAAGTRWSDLNAPLITPLGGDTFQLDAQYPPGTQRFFRALGYGPDRDVDGINSTEETKKYEVTVRYGNGTQKIYESSSDPRLADTDGDGLSDYEERLLQLDARSIDTDGDLLSDADERNIYLSNPAMQDTDGDSGGNSAFFDKGEFEQFGTSPRLADTDADGVSDREEVLTNSTNPLVSEIPKPSILIDEKTVDVRLNVTYSNEEGGATNFSARLSQTKGSALSRSDAVANQVSVETSGSITAGLESEAGVPPSAAVSVSATASIAEGYTRQNTTTIDRTSSETAQQEYQNYVGYTSSRREQFSSGRISVDLTVKNEGTVSFKLSNLSVLALKPNPNNSTNFQTVATLKPAIPDLFLPPNGTVGPVNVVADDVNPDIIKELLAQPSGLIFKVVNFDLINDAGLNYVFLTQTNLNRTAGLTIDYGDGVVEKHRVATNVRLNRDGTPAGVRMRMVMTNYIRFDNKVGVFYTTATNTVSHRQVLTGVRETRTGSVADRRFWFIAGTSDRQTNPTNHFDDILLMPGDQIYLIYARDEDGDRLLDREELLYGTSDQEKDSDHDGLDDYTELRTGWIVNAPGPNYPRRVFSDPRFTDTDKDGLSDANEKAKGTDPRAADTDGDGFKDNVDPAPLVPQINTAPEFGELSAKLVGREATLTIDIKDAEDNFARVVINWGDGTPDLTLIPPVPTKHFQLVTNHIYTTQGSYTIVCTATDTRGLTSTRTELAISQGAPRNGLQAEYLFKGNTLDSSGNQAHATIGNASRTTLTDDRSHAPKRAYHFDASDYVDDQYGYLIGPSLTNQLNFTYSAWINHEVGGPAIHTIVGQADGRALFVKDNRIHFGIPTLPSELTSSVIVTNETWAHYVLTVENKGAETRLTLYKDGAISTNRTLIGPIALSKPSSITSMGIYYEAGSRNRTTAFQGAIDNVRIYNRTLTASEAVSLYADPD